MEHYFSFLTDGCASDRKGERSDVKHHDDDVFAVLPIFHVRNLPMSGDADVRVAQRLAACFPSAGDSRMLQEQAPSTPSGGSGGSLTGSTAQGCCEGRDGPWGRPAKPAVWNDSDVRTARSQPAPFPLLSTIARERHLCSRDAKERFNRAGEFLLAAFSCPPLHPPPPPPAWRDTLHHVPRRTRL